MRHTAGGAKARDAFPAAVLQLTVDCTFGNQVREGVHRSCALPCNAPPGRRPWKHCVLRADLAPCPVVALHSAPALAGLSHHRKLLKARSQHLPHEPTPSVTARRPRLLAAGQTSGDPAFDHSRTAVQTASPFCFRSITPSSPSHQPPAGGCSRASCVRTFKFMRDHRGQPPRSRTLV